MSPTSVLITNGNVMSMLAIGEWLNKHGSGLQKVFVTYKLPSSRGNIRGVWTLLYHSGLSYAWLKVWTNLFLPRELRRRKLPGNVKDLLALLGLRVPVEEVGFVNQSEIVTEARHLEVDYLVSVSATQRFRERLINTPRISAINVHYGALPAYAGLSPYFWHLLHEERRFGVTLHKITSELDAGPIVEQSYGTTEDTHTCLELALRMASRVSPLLCHLFDGDTSVEQSNEQPSAGRTYFRHPSRQQVREFQDKGFAMMDASSRKMVIQAVEQLRQEGRWDLASRNGNSDCAR